MHFNALTLTLVADVLILVAAIVFWQRKNAAVTAREAVVGGTGPVDHRLLSEFRIGLGYVLVVGAATVAYCTQFVVLAWSNEWTSSETAFERITALIFFALILSFFVATYVFCWALPPFAVSVAVARHFRTRSITYYVICGILSAAVLSPLGGWLLPYDDMIDFPPTFQERSLAAGLRFVAPAVFAAIVYWAAFGRHDDSSTIDDASVAN